MTEAQKLWMELTWCTMCRYSSCRKCDEAYGVTDVQNRPCAPFIHGRRTVDTKKIKDIFDLLGGSEGVMNEKQKLWLEVAQDTLCGLVNCNTCRKLFNGCMPCKLNEHGRSIVDIIQDIYVALGQPDVNISTAELSDIIGDLL